MKSHWRRALIVLPAVAAVPAAACAGEFGATSRATASISITIPPRVVVRQSAGAGLGLANREIPLCVAGTGLGRYRVKIVRNGSFTPTMIEPVVRSMVAGAPGCGAGAPGRSFEALVAQGAQRQATGPLTLLVVPD